MNIPLQPNCLLHFAGPFQPKFAIAWITRIHIVITARALNAIAFLIQKKPVGMLIADLAEVSSLIRNLITVGNCCAIPRIAYLGQQEILEDRGSYPVCLEPIASGLVFVGKNKEIEIFARGSSSPSEGGL